LTYEVRLDWTYDYRRQNGVVVDGTHVRGVADQLGSVEVLITAYDPERHGQSDSFEILFVRNEPPAGSVADYVTTAGAFVDVDVSHAFSDPEGDPISFAVSLPYTTHGLSVNGSHVSGVFDAVGSTFVQVVASDNDGASLTTTFSIAAALPVSGAPTLPLQRYSYADYELPLPGIYLASRFNGPALWDTSRFAQDNLVSDAGATLGRVLFYDKRLSITASMSCGSCHEQEHGFTVPTRFATGVAGLPTRRNPMALGNVRFNILNRFFSDERVNGLEAMVLVPIQDPIELDNSLDTVRRRLEETDFYPRLFADAFGTPEITNDRIARALAQFLRSMINYQTKYDAAMHPMNYDQRPEPGLVFNAQEQRGAQLFESAQCSVCHQPDTHNQERPTNNGIDVVPPDPGEGKGVFRAASLRNVVFTAPYMHDGRFSTLREVIDHYDHGVKDSPLLDAFLRESLLPEDPPRRLNLSESDKQALEAFLATLTDETFLHDPKFADPFAQ
jgi:cytochrome c peroxidase